MSKIKVGMIGCGGIANQKHFPALKANEDLNEVSAFCDIIEERALKAAEEFGTPGAKVYTDYRELLENQDVEVVHVCTPNVSHCEISVAAFEKKKHVYCEKPMAATTDDAEKIVKAWKASGMQFTVGYQNRFREEVQNLHAACENGDLGDIYYEVEDSAFGFIKMKNEATINLEASWALNILESREASTTLCGTLAGAEIHSGMSYAKNELIYNRGRNNQLMEERLSPIGGVVYFGGGGEEGAVDCRQWLKAVQKGTEPLVKPEEALVVTKILDSIYRSAKENREIRF